MGKILKPVMVEDVEMHKGHAFVCNRWILKTGGAHLDGYPATTSYFKNGDVRSESWYQRGNLYRPRSDNPSHTLYSGNGIALLQLWTDSLGRLSRLGNLPAKLEYNTDGDQINAEWWLDGRRQRTNGRATVVINKGSDTEMQWHEDDKLNKLIYVEEYRDNGKQIQEKRWYKDGDIHREGEPAKITYRTSGKVWRVLWYKDGLKHRIDGPAHTIYDDRFAVSKDGIVKEQWALDGEFMEFNDWLEKSPLPLHEKIAMKLEA